MALKEIGRDNTFPKPSAPDHVDMHVSDVAADELTPTVHLWVDSVFDGEQKV